MKNVKKVLAVLLTLTLVVAAFAACSDKDTDNDVTADANGSSAVADENKNDAEPEKDGGKVLTMATEGTFPPYEFIKGNDLVGIDIEVAGLIAEKLGMTLDVKNVKFDTIVPGVETGKFDMGMAGLTVTPDRLEKVDFTDSYATGIQAVIVKDGSDIKTVADLDGKTIGVQLGTTGDIYASDTYGEDHVKKMDNAGVAIQALLAGKIDAVIIDNEPAKNFIKANEGLVILDEEFANEDYAIAVAKGNTELMTKINDALKELIADGSVQKVVDKYIPAE